jgi:glucosamine kinase
MILIADSGSTKTDWRLIDDQQEIHQLNTIGLNPYFVTSEQVAQTVREGVYTSYHEWKGSLDIFFYGAGCSTEDKRTIVAEGLKTIFPDANIEVTHDIIAAARATCGHEPGIAAILGTGSNSCYYNGKTVAENVISPGYIFGDEGSGGQIGKALLTDYLYNELPEELTQRFEHRFPDATRDAILDAVYKQPRPNRFLASFSKFVYQNISNEYCTQLVINCFEQFFDRHICKYEMHKEVPMHVVGSVGYYYGKLLQKVANEKGVSLGKILETPIAGLTLYHLEE